MSLHIKPEVVVRPKASANQKKETSARKAASAAKLQAVPKSSGSKKEYQLRLYVAGNTARSITALKNLQNICDNHLAGRYTIELIDLIVTPQLAAGDQIFAVPTLVRKFPEPLRKIIGDLSNEERVLVGLDVRPIK